MLEQENFKLTQFKSAINQRINDLELNARNVEISGNLDIQKFIQMARQKDQELSYYKTT